MHFYLLFFFLGQKIKGRGWLLCFFVTLLLATRGTCQDDDDELGVNEEDTERWVDSPITTQLWQVIHSGNIDGLNRNVSPPPPPAVKRKQTRSPRCSFAGCYI